MTTIYHNADANPDAIAGQHIAVIGYGNQGRCWALNFRDSGCRVSVHVRADSSRQMARDDGFEAADIEAASSADIICMVVPDDVIPKLPVSPRDDALVIVASGYYDLICPFFDTEYTFARNGILQDRVTLTYYEAGHMMYVHEPDLVKIAADIRKFLTTK